MRPNIIISALLLSVTLSAASAADGEKVEVTSLPDAVKTTVSKEAPDATKAMKTSKDGKTTYSVKGKDAEGKPITITIGEDGVVISKEPAKKHDKKDK